MQGLCVMNDAVRASDVEIRDAESRAEAAEREVARLREEYNANVSRARQMAAGTIARVREEHEADSRCATELTKTKVRRARREGKRHVCAEMSVRRERFGTHFAEAAEAYRMSGEFREQRGVAGGLDFTQREGYSYDAEFAKHSSRVSRLEKKRADFPALEADVWETWDPIVVSPDTVEVGYDVPDTSGEVDQPWTGKSSLSGFYNFD